MAVVRWEPVRELAALQNEMSRFMNQVWGTDTGTGSATWLPAVDVWETEEEVVLAFDLPGVGENDLSIEVDDGTLTVSGERTRHVEQETDRFYRFERRFGQFSRSVTLPQGTDASRIQADVKEGVLEIRVPKPEQRKPTRVTIGTRGTIEGESTRTPEADDTRTD
jgi:HSP20 family protein